MHIPSCVSCYPEYVLFWCWGMLMNPALLSPPSVILTSRCFRINNHTIEWRIANKTRNSNLCFCFTNPTRSTEECWNVSSQIQFKFISLYLARFSPIVIISRSPAQYFFFFCYYAITDSVTQTEWLSRRRPWRSVCVCVCTCACESALQKGKKICQVWNNGLACVKMNTVIGINDLMGA